MGGPSLSICVDAPTLSEPGPAQESSGGQGRRVSMLERVGRSDPRDLPPFIVLRHREGVFCAQRADDARVVAARQHEPELLIAVKRSAGADGADRWKITADQPATPEGGRGDDHRCADEDDVLEDVLTPRASGRGEGP